MDMNATSKKDAILSAATALFIERGYERTCMEDIAKSANVAKQTLYSHFSNKQTLFKEIIHNQTEYFLSDLPMDNDLNVSIDDFLTLIGHKIFTILKDTHTVELLRLVIGETRQFPDLGVLYYDTCVAPAIEKLGTFLVGHDYKGDAIKTSKNFFGMVSGHFVIQSLLDNRFDLNSDMLSNHVEQVVSDYIIIIQHQESRI